MYVLFLLLLCVPGEMFIENTEIFFPLSPRYACMDSNGRFFIADSKEKQIVCFDPQGKEAFRFGAEGKGLGEFEVLTEIYIINKQIIVGSRAFQSIFDLDGKYVRRVRAVEREMKKTSNGWVGHNYFRDQPVSLVWYSEDLSESKTFATLAVKYRSTGKAAKLRLLISD